MKSLKFFGLCTLLLCMVACNKSNESEEPTPTPTPTPPSNAPTITIDNSILTNGLSFTDAAGDNSITFTTDADWILNVAETRAVDWCTPSATSGVKGTATVKFSVTENTGYDNRKVAVTIKAGPTNKTFTISQKQKDALLVTTDKYEIDKVGGEIEVEIKANIDYQIEIDEDAKSWISESTTRSLTSRKHAFVISASEEYDKREGEIYVKSGDKQEIIKVYQAGGAVLLLSQNEYVVSDAGGTISVELKSNFDFGVQMPEVDWITETPNTRSVSTHTLKYDIAPNETYDSRSAEIVFYDKNSDLKEIVKIEQKQHDALLVTTNKYELDQNGGLIEIEVKANIDYQIEIDESAKSWINENTTRSLTDRKYSFTIASNDKYEKRVGVIYVKSGDKQETIKVYQSGSMVLLLSQNEYVVSDAGETITIEIKSNIEFGIQMPEVDWITETPNTRSVSTHTLKYDISPNDTYDSRSAEIIFYDKNSDLKEIVKIEQVQKDALILSKSEYTIPSEGETIEVVLQSNVKFDVSIDADWISQVDAPSTRGLEEHKLYFKVDENTLEEERSINITITDTNKKLSQIIEVTQEKAGEPLALMVDGSTFNQKLKELSGDLENIKSIDFIVNDGSKPTANYVLLSCPDSDYHIYATYNNGNVRVFTIGNCFVFNTDCSRMFEYLTCVISINFSNYIYTFNVTDMSYMFHGCSALTSLDLSSFDTSSVTDMNHMFYFCTSLTSLDLSSFNTRNVTDMSYMFSSCIVLSSLDLSNFNTWTVTDMNHMFWCCRALASLDLSSFNTSNVESMNSMFNGCSALTSLDLSNFNTWKVTDMGYMFYNCSALTSLNLSSFNTVHVTIMYYMFYNCSALTSLDLSSFNTSKVTYSMEDMFYNCSALTSLNLSSFNTSSVTVMSAMFRNCYNLASLDLSSFNFTKVAYFYQMFRDLGKEAENKPILVYVKDETTKNLLEGKKDAGINPNYAKIQVK